MSSSRNLIQDCCGMFSAFLGPTRQSYLQIFSFTGLTIAMVCEPKFLSLLPWAGVAALRVEHRLTIMKG